MMALLSVEGDNAVVRWRLLRPNTPSIKSVALHLNGRPLTGPHFEAIVDASDPPPVLVLVDVSTASRTADLSQERLRALRFLDRARGRSVALAAYDVGQAHLLPRGDPAAMLAALGTQAVEPNLRRAIESAIPLLPESRWRRRGLYVFTDGRGSSGLDVDALVRTATATETAVTFVLTPGSRAGDREALGRLAAETGGFLIADEGAFAALLREPFGLLDTGAILRYRVQLGPHYVWDDKPLLEAIFSYDGDRRATLRLSPDVREAGWFESIGALVLEATDLIVLVLLGAGFLTAIVVLVRRWLARRDVTASPTPAPVVSSVPPSGPAFLAALPAAEPALPSRAAGVIADARLENLVSGAIHPIGPGGLRIGRGRDNDLRLTDTTVSQAHAVLTQEGPGRYRIMNLSRTNPTLLNGQPCTEAVLRDGEMLSFGATELHFRCTA